MSVTHEQMQWIEGWIEGSGYGRSLGVRVDSLSDDSARLSLGFRPECSNGDTALHGGVAASMVAMGAGAVARAALSPESGPWHAAALQVGYLSAALSEGIAAHARLLRRGKELVYVDVDVSSDSGKPVAKGVVTVRGRFGEDDVPTPLAVGDDGESDPGPMGPFIASVPFHGILGLAVEHMADGRSRITMPAGPATADGGGGVHEGAILALLDTVGAMAAWAETGPGRYKASTTGLQARILESAPAADLVGFGRLRHRDRELLFCDVEISRAADRRLVAVGTVNYRIVTPEVAR